MIKAWLDGLDALHDRRRRERHALVEHPGHRARRPRPRLRRRRARPRRPDPGPRRDAARPTRVTGTIASSTSPVPRRARLDRRARADDRQRLRQQPRPRGHGQRHALPRQRVHRRELGHGRRRDADEQRRVRVPAGRDDAARFSVTVRATNIAGDGVPGNGDATDQDFALLVYNGTTCASATITTQPANQTACVGSPATFSVVASGAGLTYQWRKNGSNIAGATAASYTIPSVVAGDAGNYDVVVTSGCSVTSNTASLTVNTAGRHLPAAHRRHAVPGDFEDLHGLRIRDGPAHLPVAQERDPDHGSDVRAPTRSSR